MGKIVETSIINLFQKYINGQCNQQELEEVFSILKHGDYQAEWLEVIADEADQVLALGLHSNLSTTEINSIYTGIAIRLPSKSKKLYQLWSRIAVAAVVILIAGAGLFYYNTSQQLTYANDVAPGKVGATLMLASGKKINLTDAVDGKLADEAGIAITKAKNGQLVYEIKDSNTASDKINTLTTAKGETYQLKLPDGTSIWLNSASSLKYPASFASLKSRSVELTGEAYFEVAKVYKPGQSSTERVPFFVKTARQEVEVLGTHFNINSYADEPAVKTTLLEGSVKVIGNKQSQVLRPGQEAINTGNHVYSQAANINEVMAWKDGYYRFYDTEITDVMRQIARWYNVEVIYTGNIPKVTFNGRVSRSRNISQVLMNLEKTKEIRFKIEGRKVYVSE